MCQPTSGKPTTRVVISGAGPAGLLLTSLLLARNKESDATAYYDVTLIDGLQDFGGLTKEELQKSFRSWMLGLANHGLDAIRELPRLYEDYVKGEGVEIDELMIYVGGKKMSAGAAAPDVDSENFIVDRNFIVAAIARYVKDVHAKDEYYHAMYNSRCQYVDYENKRVLVRDAETQKESYVGYDLLVGCDGIRSTVREAMVKRHSNFSCHVTDIFQNFKAVHVDLPDDVSSTSMSIIPTPFPLFQGIALPETGGKVNITCGYSRNNIDNIAEELKSDDYKVVAKYVKENFAAFGLVDYDDFAKQWVGQRWNQTGMVHCNFYHSSQLNIVLMGDAAHATSPSIGMGMNTALRDAQAFYNILKKTKDNLAIALPKYSEERVKEGNSLTSLAFNLYCLDQKQQAYEIIHQIVRTILHKFFPSFVKEHPQTMIGRRGIELSDVFSQSIQLGIMQKYRAINERIIHEHFEESCGMVKASEESGSVLKYAVLVCVCAVSIGAFMSLSYSR